MMVHNGASGTPVMFRVPGWEWPGRMLVEELTTGLQSWVPAACFLSLNEWQGFRGDPADDSLWVGTGVFHLFWSV